MRHELAQLQRMLDARLFVIRPRMATLLRFLVEESVHNGGGPISQQSIAAHALPLPDDFQPTKSAYVRTHVARLRRTLRDYYATTGRDDPIIFSLTPGPYRLIVTEAQRHAIANGDDAAAPRITTIPKRDLPTLLLLEPDDDACLPRNSGIGRNVALEVGASLVTSPFVTAVGPLTRDQLAKRGVSLIEFASLWGYEYVCDASIKPKGASSFVCNATATDVYHRQPILEESTTIREQGSAAAAGIATWLFHRLSDVFMIKRMETHGGASR